MGQGVGRGALYLLVYMYRDEDSKKGSAHMYLDVSDAYPKMYLGLVWETCKIHAKYQDKPNHVSTARPAAMPVGLRRAVPSQLAPEGERDGVGRHLN